METAEGNEVMSESRLQKLEGRTYHIDGKVAAIETQLGTQGAQLTRIEQHMLAPKPPVNYGVWIGIGLTILFGFGSAMLGISQYMDTQLNQVKGAVFEVNTELKRHREHQVKDAEAAMGKEFTSGKRAGQLEQIAKQLDHLDERGHWMDKRLRAEENKSSAAIVSRKAIGDYAEELGGRIEEFH